MKQKAALLITKREAERLRLWFTGDGPGKLTPTANLMLTVNLTPTANLMLTANLMRRPFDSGCRTGPADTVMAEKNGLLLPLY